MIVDALTIKELYGYSDDEIELPYENGSTRVVFHRVDNTISFLFMDPNHHIYFDKNKVEASGSLFYDTCPIYDEHLCPRMDYLGTCFAFEFLDKNKYDKTYEYSNTGNVD